MSFREGDEVIVACQVDDNGNLTPKYVLGFVDKGTNSGEQIAQYVPRIGEDIIKMVGGACVGHRWTEEEPYDYKAADPDPGPLWVRCSQMGQLYSGGDKGPDNLALKLVQPAKRILKKSQPTDIFLASPPGAWFQGNNWNENIVMTGWTNIVGELTIFYNYDAYCAQLWADETEQFYLNIYHYLIPVGAILYLLQFIFGSYLITDNFLYTTTIYLGGGPAFGDYVGIVPYDQSAEYAAAYISNLNAQGVDNQVNSFQSVNNQWAAWLAEHLQLPSPGTANNPYLLMALAVFAAPYSDDLYNSTKGASPTISYAAITDYYGKMSNYVVSNNTNIFEQYAGFTYQSLFSYTMSMYPLGPDRPPRDNNKYINCDPPFPGGGQGVNITTRPHTKAELQAAGLWPFNN
jgi:hypothetical protein